IKSHSAVDIETPERKRKVSRREDEAKHIDHVQGRLREPTVCARDLSMAQRIRDLSWWVSLDFLVPVSLIRVVSPRSPVTNVFPLYHVALPYISVHSDLEVRCNERTNYYILQLEHFRINRMKILVFATCILAAATVSDGMVLDNIINTLISKAVDLKDLINFHMTFAQCVVKMGLLSDNFQGSKKEKSFKSMECGTAMVKVKIYLHSIPIMRNKMTILVKPDALLKYVEV
ncbi:hypothetical protein ALC57_15261, partial [Trachymyrmex cornetzi]